MTCVCALEISRDWTVRFAMRVIKKSWRSARFFGSWNKVEKRKMEALIVIEHLDGFRDFCPYLLP